MKPFIKGQPQEIRVQIKEGESLLLILSLSGLNCWRMKRTNSKPCWHRESLMTLALTSSYPKDTQSSTAQVMLERRSYVLSPNLWLTIATGDWFLRGGVETQPSLWQCVPTSTSICVQRVSGERLKIVVEQPLTT